MNYEEARAYLKEISARGNLLGLDSIRILLRELGNPQDRLRFVHIAGTNGKGSVMAYLCSILKDAGYQVGRYISPTLFCYEERIQVNGSYIPKADVARLTGQIAQARERIASRGEPAATIFEVETALSFLFFAERNCDLVLLETGLGGREDATNVVTTTLLEIIASISMDHMELLGDTLEQIAWNKAGIIKPGTRVVSDRQKPEAEGVLRRVCKEQQASLHFLEDGQFSDIVYGLKEQQFSYRGMEGLSIHLAGTCQVGNAALAVDAALELQKLGYKIEEGNIRRGLQDTVWEGRFQLLSEGPAVVIDGAHNPDAARVLMDAVQHYFQGKKIYYIFGVFSDKEYDKIIEITASRAEWIFTVETKENPRALPAEILAERIRPVNPKVTAVGDVKRALEAAFSKAAPEDVILVFGSLSFLWEAREYMQAFEASAGGKSGSEGL